MTRLHAGKTAGGDAVRFSTAKAQTTIGHDVASVMSPRASEARQLRDRRIAMGFLSWIVLGAIAGWLGSLLVNRTGEGLLRDIILGIVGGIVGGWLFSMMGSTGVTGFNLWSLFVAVVGAVVILVLYHAIFGRAATR
jgi:uncharacterized membrane protein YeaQ/YmgE (transglycosylase-associated protein family)